MEQLLNSELGRNVAVAMVSVILGFLSSFAIAAYSERKKPSKRISYDLNVARALEDVQASFEDKIEIRYRGLPTKKLFHVRCAVENAGNAVVKQQYIRFNIAPTAEILDRYIDPQPLPEIGVEEAEEARFNYQPRYRIAHFERGQRVVFNFILSTSGTPDVAVVPFNEEGDVRFEPRVVTKVADEQERIKRAAYLILLFFLVPPIALVVPGVGSELLAVIRIILLIMLAPLLLPLAAAISGLLLDPKKRAYGVRVANGVVVAEGGRLNADTVAGTVNNPALHDIKE